MRIPAACAAGLLAALSVVIPGWAGPADPSVWAPDTAAVVNSSDVLLRYPGLLARQAMPVGNGALGAAVWSANGLTAQLNRPDALPDRESPGQVVIPGLARLTAAADYTGRLDLYNGEFTESGGGMTAVAQVQADADVFVVDVTGADPNTVQTASVHLWPPRRPSATVSGPVATLSETWPDTGRPGSTGQTFGTLAALTAGGRDARASVTGGEEISVSFRPWPDGSFRVIVAAPHWAGGDAARTAARLPGGEDRAGAATARTAHLAWWHGFWRQAGLVQASSSDGSAQYLAALRTIDLYTAAAQRGARFPGSQAGVADLFGPTRDYHRWDPSAYWHWNLRMQVAANLSAGLPQLNAPYFRLYTENLTNIENWTATHMAGRAGACVPETMRFNGAGVQYSGSLAPPSYDCDAAFPPFYNARTLTTGAEVALWAWQQYLMTGDTAFLRQEFPLLAASARFLLAYATPGPDGYLHTYPANAHETQWDVHDPATDIAAMSALFPAVVRAAAILGADQDLAARLAAAIPHLPPLPRTDAATQTMLLPPSADSSGADVIAPSYDPAAPKQNSENIGLEPVWPYGLIGDDAPLTALAGRTFTDRPYPLTDDWSFDPVQAARLGLSSEVESSLVTLTEKYQLYPAGFASFGGPEFYSEQLGVVAATLDEALVQDYDGLLRIAPAWPSGWDVDGTVYVQGSSKVTVRVRGGVPVAVGYQAGADQTQRVRDPWPGQPVRVVDSRGRVVLASSGGSEFTMTVRKGQSYSIERESAPTAPVTPIGAGPATVRHLGTSTLGVDTFCRPDPGAGPIVDWVPSAGTTISGGATVVGPANYTTDPEGHPAVEVGSGSYLRSSSPIDLGGFGSVTFAARLRLTGTTDTQVLFDDDSAFTLLLKPGGAVRFQSPWANLSTSVKVPAGRFTDLVVTIDDNGLITVYLDGQAAGTAEIGPLSLGACGATALRFGASLGGGDQLTAAVGEMEIWPRALDAGQVARLTLR